MSAVVGVASENGGGAVDLFCEHNAGKLMRQRDAAEREEEVGTIPRLGRPAIRRADGEDKALSPIISKPAKAASELLRRELLTAAIQQDRGGTDAPGLESKPVEQDCLGVKKL
jgi:hypothetical protein